MSLTPSPPAKEEEHAAADATATERRPEGAAPPIPPAEAETVRLSDPLTTLRDNLNSTLRGDPDPTGEAPGTAAEAPVPELSRLGLPHAGVAAPPSQISTEVGEIDDPEGMLRTLSLPESGKGTEAGAEEVPPASSEAVPADETESELSEADQVFEVDDTAVAMEPGPIEQAVAQAKDEDHQARIALYERELQWEQSRARAALLEHEIGDELERHGNDEGGAVKAYARSLAADPMLRPNLWAVRRIFYRRKLWPSLLKLLDAEARYASSDAERAELWTEKGHVLEDCLGEMDEAIRCYKTAHRLDPGALAPLSALEKVFSRQGDNDSLIEVYRGLAAATQEPGRRVALLVDLARIEEAQYAEQGGIKTATVEGSALDRAISYLHAAYDVGVDQLRVVDEIVRITAAHDRVPDCLAALDVKTELLELIGQQASQKRERALVEEIIAIRRWQAALCREPLRDPQLGWQYLQAANERSPGDPLILHDMIELAEALSRWDDLQGLLQILLERQQESRPDEPPLYLWLRRAHALRQGGREEEALQLEQQVGALAAGHLPLLLMRERRALRRHELYTLAELYQEEARLAEQGLSLHEGEAPRPDPLWSCGALQRAASCLMQAGEYARAEEILLRTRDLARSAGTSIGEGSALPSQWHAQERIIDDALEQVYGHLHKWAELCDLFARQLAEGSDGTRAARLHESLVEVLSEHLGDPAQALLHNDVLCQHFPDDLRVHLRAVELCRRAGDVPREAAALLLLLDLEQRTSQQHRTDGLPLSPSQLRIDTLLRRAELLAEALSDEAGAIDLYEEVLRSRPGEPRALDPLEQLLRRAGRFADLQQLLRRQADACATAAAAAPGADAQGEAADDGDLWQKAQKQRLLELQIKLAEIHEQEMGQPEQAAAIYRDLLILRPGYPPALRALCRLYRKLHDGPRLCGALELLAEALGRGEAQADVLLRLGEVYEHVLGRPRDAEDAYGRSLFALAPSDPAAVHAQLGKLRTLLYRGDHAGLPQVLGLLAEAQPLGDAAERAWLAEERTWLSMAVKDGAEALLPEVPETESGGPQIMLQLGRWRQAALHGDGRAQGAALALLAAGTADDQVRGGLWLRAGLLGSLHEEGSDSTQERLLAAYALLPQSPEVVVALTDALENLADGQGPAVQVFAARRALCPEGEVEDRLELLLAQAEAHLSQAGRAGTDQDRQTQCRQAAEAALEVLSRDGQNIPALLLLRQAIAPDLGFLQGHAHADAYATAVRTYAQHTLRLADLLKVPERKAALYVEAAGLFRLLGDGDAEAASLRAALDHTPHDTAAFGQAYELLMKRAQPEDEGGKGDAGPLLELLDFRLSQEAESESMRVAEVPLKMALLLQRAALLQAASHEARAIADLRAILALDPGHLIGRRRLGDLLAQSGNPDEALQHYEYFLTLPTDDDERRGVHLQIAAVLADTDPARASTHLQHAIAIGEKQREAGRVPLGPEEALAESGLYRWQVKLLLMQQSYAEAVAVLWQLATLLPPGPEHGIEQARIELEIADILQHEAGDLRGALSALERALRADPISLEALDRLVPLCAELHERQRLESFLGRAVAEARTQAQAQPDGERSGEPYHALAQIFSWQGQGDMQNLARQAEAAVNGPVIGQDPPAVQPPREPTRDVVAQMGGGVQALGSPAFEEDARGLLLELWREMSDSANRLLGVELPSLSANPKERLNARAVPAVWEPVDRLARRFGLSPAGIPYGLYLSRDRELCQLCGPNLVCGSAYAAEVAQMPPRLYFRLVRHLALLPDRLGPLLAVRPDELLLFVAACCRLIEVRGPELSSAQKDQLEERVRTLAKIVSRKEKKALLSLAARMDSLLAFSGGRSRIETWHQAVTTGAARLGLALCGNLQAALSDLGVHVRDKDTPGPAAQLARALLLFSVSAEMQQIRRELGIAGQENDRVVAR